MIVVGLFESEKNINPRRLIASYTVFSIHY